MEKGEKYGISEEDLLEAVGKYPGFRREEFERQRDIILSIPQMTRPDGSKGMLMVTRRYEGSGFVGGGPLQRLDEKIQIDFPDLGIGSVTISARLARLGQDSAVFTMEQGHYLVDYVGNDPLSQYTDEQRKQIMTWMYEILETIAKEHGLEFRNGVLSRGKMNEIPFGQVRGELKKTLDGIVEASKAIKQKADEYVAKRLAPV